MLVYGSYELYKREISNAFPDLDKNRLRFISAMLGDITGSVWVVPFEAAKQRVQSGIFPNVGTAFSHILKQEGVRGLFCGYKAQVLRDVTYHAIQLPLYEAVKDLWVAGGPVAWAAEHLGGPGATSAGKPPRRRLSPWESMACGAVAGAASGAMTTPLDVIKTRMMTSAMGGSGRSMTASMRGILQRVSHHTHTASNRVLVASLLSTSAC